VTVPPVEFGKAQISPTRDSRLRWMQSVVRCTHYVAGAGELQYLKQDEAPEITFVTRDAIDDDHGSYIGASGAGAETSPAGAGVPPGNDDTTMTRRV